MLVSNIMLAQGFMFYQTTAIITQFTRSISCTRSPSVLSVPVLDVKFSNNKHIGRWVHQENLTYAR